MPLPTITTARTPGHDLPYLFPGQSQKEPIINEALARIDALLQPVVLEERAAPPAEPSPGDCYLLTAAATGVWSGHDHSLAVWAENQWLYLAPREGVQVYDLTTAAAVRFTIAGGWQRTPGPALPTGGATQDSEARAAIASIVAALRQSGVFSG